MTPPSTPDKTLFLTTACYSSSAASCPHLQVQDDPCRGDPFVLFKTIVEDSSICLFPVPEAPTIKRHERVKTFSEHLRDGTTRPTPPLLNPIVCVGRSCSEILLRGKHWDQTCRAKTHCTRM